MSGTTEKEAGGNRTCRVRERMFALEKRQDGCARWVRGRRGSRGNVGLPRSMPYFFASLKVAVTLAFVGSIISETLAGNRGIGYLMVQASSSFRVPLLFAGLVTVAAMGVGMYALFAVLERRLTSWAFRGTS